MSRTAQPLLLRHVTFIMLTIALFITAKPALSDEAPAAIHVAGAIAKPSDWTVSALKKQFAAQIKPVEYSSRGSQHTCNCVPLLAVLTEAGVATTLKMDPKADPKLKNHPLRMIIVVQARDGYAAAFSLAELMPNVGNRAAWLALDMDGSDLSERDGPIKLIVPEDAMPGRSVRGVGSIVVVDGVAAAGSAATQPGP